MTPRWERIGGTASLAAFTAIITALGVVGLLGLV